ncbi:hypothetical protein PENSTE_c007G01521 [Penicillium steckii]|uniref:Uncharacterized protein n=1 Tax=Penicillium steckii TaxID=303698 RepID=A0A1V6TDB3_9EURO|nr:hypothetical protein PENSTE_c007G01521 [Penicillium steckii]
MPAPLAKGLIVTFSVLVAAGVAVYQSPQFQEWITTSRRKIALALHNLGDEIHPRDLDALHEDISMSEEVGEAAEERRRIARAEIMRRAILLESHRQSKTSDKPLDSFDTLVDNDGNLRAADNERGKIDDKPAGASTGIDTGIATQPLRRGDKSGQNLASEGDQLHYDVFSGTASNYPSESAMQYTPTSETPGEVLFDPFSDSPSRTHTPVSLSGSSHTEDHPRVYYAHPNPPSNSSNQEDLLTDLDDLRQGNQTQHPVSSTPSTAGSYSHCDASSDGTLSDFGGLSVGGVATPASWSEVGSVISNEDAGHHQLL